MNNVHVRGIMAKEVFPTMAGEDFMFPCATGVYSQPGISLLEPELFMLDDVERGDTLHDDDADDETHDTAVERVMEEEDQGVVVERQADRQRRQAIIV